MVEFFLFFQSSGLAGLVPSNRPRLVLVKRFTPNIAARIVDTTPTFKIRDASDMAGSRYRKILAYLDGSGADWWALDDDVSLFPPGCAELVLCDDGFRDHEERALGTALDWISSLKKLERLK